MEEKKWPEWERINELWNQGVSSRDWPTENLPALIEETRDQWPAAYILQIAYYIALARGNYQEANNFITEALEEAGKWGWQDDFLLWIAFENIFIKSILRMPTKQWDYLFQHLPDLNVSYYAASRAYIAVKTANREMNEANTCADEFRAWIHKENPDLKPNIQEELDWIDLALGESKAWHKDPGPLVQPS